MTVSSCVRCGDPDADPYLVVIDGPHPPGVVLRDVLGAECEGFGAVKLYYLCELCQQPVPAAPGADRQHMREHHPESTGKLQVEGVNQ